jgi:transposase InsO family protein
MFNGVGLVDKRFTELASENAKTARSVADVSKLREFLLAAVSDLPSIQVSRRGYQEFGASLGFIVCTTPSYSPEPNGMAEAFVKTFKRDYVYLHRLETAATVLGHLPNWFEEYNEVHPHRGLKMLSPREYLEATR